MIISRLQIRMIKIKLLQFVADFVDKCKQMIHREITFNGRPMISMLTSVQSNRSGITANRHPDAIIDDESIVSLSDQITQFASHLFILRPRLPRNYRSNQIAMLEPLID